MPGVLERLFFSFHAPIFRELVLVVIKVVSRILRLIKYEDDILLVLFELFSNGWFLRVDRAEAYFLQLLMRGTPGLEQALVRLNPVLVLIQQH